MVGVSGDAAIAWGLLQGQGALAGPSIPTSVEGEDLAPRSALSPYEHGFKPRILDLGFAYTVFCGVKKIPMLCDSIPPPHCLFKLFVEDLWRGGGFW